VTGSVEGVRPVTAQSVAPTSDEAAA
jgi:hypothetical protein